MPDWSPASPDTIGVGWRPGDNGHKLISTGYQSLAWRFTADVTETITDILIPVTQVDANGSWIVEVYEDGDEVAGDITTTIYRPNGGGAYGGGTSWQKQDAATTNIWQSVDGATFDASTYITFVEPSPAITSLAFEFGTAAWPAGRRVTDIRVNMIANTQDGSASFQGFCAFTGFAVFGGSSGIGTEYTTSTYSLGELNPISMLPWTQADITGLDTSNTLGFNGTSLITDLFGVRIYQVWVEIDWVPEDRIVVGVEEILTSASVPTWLIWNTILDPNVNANADWDKVDGTAYVVTARNLGNVSELYDGTMRFPWLSDGEPLPTGWEQSYLPVDATGLISVPFDDYTTMRSTGLLFWLSDGSDSADGQPWAALDGYTSVTTRQQITTAVGGTYERVRFGWLDTTDLSGITPPAGDLTVEVKRQSDNVQFGSTETFTVAQLQAGTLIGTAQANPQTADVEAPLYLIERDFTTPATLGIAQYYIEFTGGHAVAVAQPGFSFNPDGNATYHGATDRGTIGSTVNPADYPATLSTVPDFPIDFQVEAIDTALLTATDTACGVDTFDYVHLTWDDTALGSSFGYYEIQRDNGDALGFQTIAVITDETVEAARDYESIRGTVDYRMRVVRSTDGIASAWTDTETAVRDAAGEALWLFTSNAYPDLTCAYNVTDTQTYGWPDADRQRVVNHYGSENKTRYVEVERRLTEFTLPLTIYSQGLTSDITQNLGVAPFYPLLELCSQTSAPGVAKTVTPYVCVVDPNGNSWYAAVTVDAGTVLVSQSNAHTCPAKIVQLTEEPCPFDVEGEGS